MFFFIMSMNIDGSFIIAIASIGFFSLPKPADHSADVSRVLIAGVPMEPEQHHGRYRGRQSSSSTMEGTEEGKVAAATGSSAEGNWWNRSR